jgi:hypothetical protein
MQIFTQGLDELKAPIIASIPELADLLYLAHPGFVHLGARMKLVQEQKPVGWRDLLVETERLDRALQRFRSPHLATAMKYLPEDSTGGTGATEGVPYLQANYRHSILPTNNFDWPLPPSEGVPTVHVRPVLSIRNTLELVGA